MHEAAPFEATFRFAAALVQDGTTGVTVIVPRGRGVLARARSLAAAAGVSVSALEVGSTSITLRFSGEPREIRRHRSAWTRLFRRRTA